jgi:dipeptidyl aminopeptidase/acylaminoacyl peptidase
MGMRVLLIAAAAALAVLAAGARGAQLPQTIAYTHARDVWTIDADGSDARALTQTGLDGQPAWSPDGSQIAFVSSRDGVRPELWIMNADGSGAHRVTPVDQIVAHPAWSRQGLIAFDDFSGILTIRPDGSGLTRLTSEGTRPSWSADGAHVAYTFHNASTNTFDVVAVVDADGTGSHVVASGTSPAYSPDGTRLAWSARSSTGDATLVVANADGTGPQTIFTAHPTYTSDLEPAWSPDSATIAFDGGPNAEIYALPAHGGAPVRLTTSADDDTDASWRPAIPSTGLTIVSVRFRQRACATRPGIANVTVTDAQGRPLEHATVRGGGRTAATDAAGVATIAPVVGRRHRGRLYLTITASLTARPAATKHVSLPRCR